MTTAITRAIQRKYGYKELPYTCSECGHTRPALSSVPTSSVLGVSGLIWAISGRRLLLGGTIRCPQCGEQMTLEEELARRRRKA